MVETPRPKPKGKLAWNSYSHSAQVGSLSCSRDRDQGRGEPTCAPTPDTPTSARVASCPTNRCSARSPAPSSTDRRPSSTTPNTSVASQRIVPGEPSGKSITQQHAVPPLERLRRHQPAEQRVRLGYHPHPTRQDRTQLLQSVAFTPGTGGDSGQDQESGRSHRGNGRRVRPRRRPNSLGHQRFQVMGVQETLKARLSQPWTNNTVQIWRAQEREVTDISGSTGSFSPHPSGPTTSPISQLG
jgi:hypothetical protein